MALNNQLVQALASQGISVGGVDSAIPTFPDLQAAIAAGTSDFKIGTQLYIGGVKQANKPTRLKFATLGCSINGYNLYEYTATNRRKYPAEGFLQWAHMLSGAGFDRCKTVSTLDHLVGGADYGQANYEFNYQQLWAVGTTYAIGDVVRTDATHVYYSLTAGNVGNTPSPTVDTVFWSIYATGSTWSSHVTYTLGDTVTTNSTSYWYCLGNSVNEAPASTPASWRPIPIWSTHPITGVVNASGRYHVMDSFGNITFPNSNTNEMISRIPQVLSNFIEVPDVFMLSSLFENDGLLMTSDVSISNAKKIIQYIKHYFPSCIIVLSAPGPNGSLSTANQLQVKAIKDWVLGYVAKNVYIDPNDALFTGDPNTFKLDWQYSQDQAGTAVHPNARGAVVRAKQFLRNFSWLMADPIEIPAITTADMPANIALTGVTTGWFGTNPDMSVQGNQTTDKGTILSGAQIQNIIFTAPTNGAQALAVTPNGVAYSTSATGALSTIPKNNQFYVHYGVTNNTGSVALSSILASNPVFRAEVKVKILSTTNLHAIFINEVVRISLNFEANNKSSIARWLGGFSYQDSFTQGLDGALAVGDELTYVSNDFTLGAATKLDSLIVRSSMMGIQAAGAGPSIEIQRMQLVRVG